MKEFGLYTARQKYISLYQQVANKSFDSESLKITKRPCICVKIEGQNWLVPLSKIDPTQNDYQERHDKQYAYNKHDKNNPPYAMDIFDDLTYRGIPNYESVVQYYNAFPVKHNLCREYRKKGMGHLFVPEAHREEIKENLLCYLSKARKDKLNLTGFIKFYVYKRKLLDYLNYPINCIDLQEAVYKKYYTELDRTIGKTAEIEKHKEIKKQQKDLKNLYLERGEFAPYQDLSSASQSDLSGYVGKESAAVISKETQQDLHTTQNKNQPQQVRQVGQVEQVEQVGLAGQVGQAQKSQNNVKQKAKTPNSAGKR